MRILYDYPGFEREVSGAARYFLEIIQCLDSKHQIALASRYINNIAASKYFNISSRFANGYNFKGKRHIERYIQNMSAKHLIKRGTYDVFHATGQEFYFKDVIGNHPLVVTVHDLIYELIFRNGMVDPQRLELYSRADRIIAISHHTKSDLLKLYPSLDESKVSVIYHGVSVINSEPILPNIDNYILYVGTRKEEYKNFRRFVSALSPLLQKNKELSIVCTGPPISVSENEMLASLGVKDRILNVGFVSDSELYGLYSKALVFVFPSFYEGFGIPILEAFQSDCPACISDASCFREIAGNSVNYFDPFDEKSILKSVVDIIENKDYADQLRELGKKRLELFSWEKTARQTEDVYNSIF